MIKHEGNYTLTTTVNSFEGSHERQEMVCFTQLSSFTNLCSWVGARFRCEREDTHERCAAQEAVRHAGLVDHEGEQAPIVLGIF